MASVGFRWLDILEKEFDKAFVDLDLEIGKSRFIVLIKNKPPLKINRNCFSNDKLRDIIKSLFFCTLNLNQSLLKFLNFNN